MPASVEPIAQFSSPNRISVGGALLGGITMAESVFPVLSGAGDPESGATAFIMT